MEKYPVGDRLEEGEVGYIDDLPLMFGGSRTTFADPVEVGQKVWVVEYDDSDDSYLIQLKPLGGSGIEVQWVDASLISPVDGFEPVTEEELNEVYEILLGTKNED